MKLDKLEEILQLSFEFAKRNPKVLAIGLCGSCARGIIKPDSDIDLIILVNDKLKFKNTNWIENFDFDKINERLNSFEDKEYGKVWSRHVFLKSKIEIEFTFADASWANTKKLDEGTIKVVSDGFKSIYDPQLILDNLVEKINRILN